MPSWENNSKYGKCFFGGPNNVQLGSASECVTTDVSGSRGTNSTSFQHKKDEERYILTSFQQKKLVNAQDIASIPKTVCGLSLGPPKKKLATEQILIFFGAENCIFSVFMQFRC